MVATLVTFGITSLWGSLLSGGRYYRNFTVTFDCCPHLSSGAFFDDRVGEQGRGSLYTTLTSEKKLRFANIKSVSVKEKKTGRNYLSNFIVSFNTNERLQSHYSLINIILNNITALITICGDNTVYSIDSNNYNQKLINYLSETMF